MLFVTTLALVGFASSSGVNKPVYKCELSMNTCTFTNVVLNSTHYEWQPASNSPSMVLFVEFTGSKIPVVTKNLCEAFPNLWSLKMGNLEVEEVKEDALHSCSGLNWLELMENQIEQIYPNTFVYNGNTLRQLFLDSNRIQTLDHHLLSNLTVLEDVGFARNNLKTFSPELIRHNKKLRTLGLMGNGLSDIDAEQIVKFLPDLKQFTLVDNEIPYTRAVEIYRFLDSKGIYYGQGTEE